MNTVCEICGQGFPAPDQLNRHRRVIHPAEVRAANMAVLAELKANLMAKLEAPARMENLAPGERQ